MIEVRCRVLDPGRTGSTDSVLRIYADGSAVRGAPSPYTTRIERLSISDRVANIPRRIEFDDGMVCEIDDNDSLDRALERARATPARRRLHQLESRWRWIAGAVLLTVAFGFLAIERGLPLLAEWTASRLPYAARAELGERALEALDRELLKPSSTSRGERERLREHARIVQQAGDIERLQLVFRTSSAMGANALALPGGTVIVTDALLDLAEDEQELVAVLAHEAGHVKARHGARMALQNAGAAVVAIAVSGDISWLAAAVPASLLMARYSRAFEREADRFAADVIDRLGIDRAHARRILRRLREQNPAGMPGLLSSHPGIEERLQDFEDPG